MRWLLLFFLTSSSLFAQNKKEMQTENDLLKKDILSLRKEWQDAQLRLSKAQERLKNKEEELLRQLESKSSSLESAQQKNRALQQAQQELQARYNKETTQLRQANRPVEKYNKNVDFYQIRSKTLQDSLQTLLDSSYLAQYKLHKHGLEVHIPSSKCFYKKSKSLLPAFRPVVDSLASLATLFDDYTIEVQVHLNYYAESKENIRVAQKQAWLVYSYLDGKLSPAQMRLIPMGNAAPSNYNDPEEKKLWDNRIEICFRPKNLSIDKLF